MKPSIRHYTLNPTIIPQIKAAGVLINCGNSHIGVYAIYCSPKLNIKEDEYNKFFSNFESKLIVSGDFNVKHPWWGSRCTNPKAKGFYKHSK